MASLSTIGNPASQNMYYQIAFCKCRLLAVSKTVANGQCTDIYIYLYFCLQAEMNASNIATD